MHVASLGRTTEGRDIPLQRITQVSYERGVLDRILGCGTSSGVPKTPSGPASPASATCGALSSHAG